MGGRRFHGKKFYQQHMFLVDDNGRETFYTADCYSHEERLIVEVDGEIHEQQSERDAYLSVVIGQHGVRIIRYADADVEHHLSAVLKDLERWVTFRDKT